MLARPTLLTLMLATVLVAGCGSSKSSSSSSSSSSAAASAPSSSASAPSPAPPSAGGGQTLELSASPSKLAFNPKTLMAKAGKITLVMTNPASFSHGVSVQGNGVDKDGRVVGKGGTSMVSATLKPGKYTYYCPVPGHRAQGMQGTLTVT